MGNSKIFIFFLCLCVASHILAAPLGAKPLLGAGICSGKKLHARKTLELDYDNHLSVLF